MFGEDALVFPEEEGGFIDPQNFRSRVSRRLVKQVLGASRDFTPHGSRHPFDAPSSGARNQPRVGGSRRWVAGRARSCCSTSTAPSSERERRSKANVLAQGPRVSGDTRAGAPRVFAIPV